MVESPMIVNVVAAPATIPCEEFATLKKKPVPVDTISRVPTGLFPEPSVMLTEDVYTWKLFSVGTAANVYVDAVTEVGLLGVSPNALACTR